MCGVIHVHVKPLRYRTFAILHPIYVEGGYTDQLYDLTIIDTLRPFRAYREQVLPLFRQFQLLWIAATSQATYMSFGLPPDREPAPLPEDLARLKRIADALVGGD